MRSAAAVAFVLLAAASAVSAASPSVGNTTTHPDRLGAVPGFPTFETPTYAGYVNVTATASLYYWFVEAESGLDDAPVVLWLNGGPGCSSLFGYFSEIGPYRISEGKWQRNPYAWNKRAHVIFLESPGGVGFSIDRANTTWNDTVVARLNYEFLQRFLTHKFPRLLGRDFYIAGESYGGHYVPQLAHAIATGTHLQLKEMLRGFMVGNPCTGSPVPGSDLDWCYKEDDPTLDEFLRTHGVKAVDPKIPFQKGSTDPYDPYDIQGMNCKNKVDPTNDDIPPVAMAAAAAHHEDEVAPSQQLDEQRQRTKRFLGPRLVAGSDPCAVLSYAELLNRTDVIRAINAVPPSHGWWWICSRIKYPVSNQTHGVLPIYRYLIANTSLRMLVYSGTSDTRVNFIQTAQVLLSLNRTVQRNYTAWYYRDPTQGDRDQLGGYYIAWDRLSWAAVRGAGHGVPTDKPAAALQLFTSFLRTGVPGLAPVLTSSSTTPPPPAPLPTHPIPGYSTAPLPQDGAPIVGAEGEDGGDAQQRKALTMGVVGMVSGVCAGLFTVFALLYLQRRRELGQNRRRAAHAAHEGHDIPLQQ